MEPEELDDLIASHAEDLTKEELYAITKVSEEEEEEEAGSAEQEEVSRSNLMVKFLGEMLQTCSQLPTGCKMPIWSWSVTSS